MNAEWVAKTIILIVTGPLLEIYVVGFQGVVVVKGTPEGGEALLSVKQVLGDAVCVVRGGI